MCSDGCVNTLTALNDCGGCNHTCLGGTCENGYCTPFVVTVASEGVDAGSFVSIADIASDGTVFAWTDVNNDLVVEYDPNAQTTTVLADSNTPYMNVIAPGSVTISGTTVYWLQSPYGNAAMGTAQLGVADSANSNGTLAGYVAQGLYATSSDVFTALYQTGSPGEVCWADCSVTGCPSSPTICSSGYGMPNVGMTVAPDFGGAGILFSDIGSSTITGTSSGFSLQTGDTQNVSFIASDSSNVYWAGTGSSIFQAPNVYGAGDIALVSQYDPTGTVTGIATDGTYVYFSLNSSIFFISVGTAGQNPAYLATITTGNPQHLKLVPNATWATGTTYTSNALIFDDGQNIYELSTLIP